VAPAPVRRGPATDGSWWVRPGSRAWPARRRSADGPSADSRVPAAAPRPAPQPAPAGARADRPLPPFPAHERSMPPQQRPRSDQTRAMRAAWQVAGRRREQAAISGAKLRPRHLAAQDLELVTQNEQLDVLDVQATTSPNERSQQGPEREVEKREGHCRRSSQPALGGRDTSIGTLQGWRSAVRSELDATLPLRPGRSS
jgi:hypothetical protein